MACTWLLVTNSVAPDPNQSCLVGQLQETTFQPGYFCLSVKAQLPIFPLASLEVKTIKAALKIGFPFL